MEDTRAPRPWLRRRSRTATVRAMSPERLDAHALADQLRTAREALLNLARDLSEGQVYHRTARAGWTLKHELASLVTHDAELVHVIEELRRRPGGAGEALTLDLRRRRGETMLRLQQLRLRPLLERIEQEGARVVEALREHGALLSRPLHLAQQEAVSAAELAHAQGERAMQAVEALRAVVAPAARGDSA